jgi:O-antigen/teichoic acid export membrane protein
VPNATIETTPATDTAPSHVTASHWSMALGSLATNATIAAIGLVTGSLAARLLGPHGRGELASVQNIPVLLGGVALIGMPSALTFFCAKDREAARGLYASSMTTALAASIPLFALGWMLLPNLLGDYGQRIVSCARIYLLFLPLQIVAALPYSVLLGIGEIATWNVLRLLPSLAWLTTLVLAGVHGLADATRVAMVYLLLYAATAAISTAAMLRKVRGGRVKPSGAEIRRLIRFGAPGALAVLPFQLNLRLDQVVMAALLPASELGMYAAAVSWSGVLTPVLGAIAPLLLPMMATRDLDDRHRAATAAQATRLSIVVAFAGSLAVVVVTPFAVRLLFGRQFASATIPAIVLTLAAGFSGLNSLLEELLKGLGAPRWPLYGQLASLPVTATLLVLLLVPYAALGAAFASLAAYATTTIVLLCGLKKVTRASSRELCVARTSEIVVFGGTFKAALRAWKS